MQEFRRIHPGVQVGSIEPLWIEPEIGARDMEIWLDTWAERTGEPFAFLSVDIDWLREGWPEVAFFGFSLRRGGRGSERSERLGLDGHLEGPLHPPTFTALAESAVERRRLSRWLRQAESRVREQASRLDLLVEEGELERRRAAWSRPEPRVRKGYLALYSKMADSTSRGASLKYR